MRIRVQPENRRIEGIEFSGSGLRVVCVKELNYLMCAGTAYLFTADGYYTGTAPIPLLITNRYLKARNETESASRLPLCLRSDTGSHSSSTRRGDSRRAKQPHRT
jgi:hypothetical protein